MDTILASVFMQWGPLGLLATLIGYMLYKHISNKEEKDEIKSITTINNGNQNNENIEKILTKMNKNLEIVTTNGEALLDFHNYFKLEIERIDKKIDKLKDIILDEIEKRLAQKLEDHNKFMFDQMKTGPKLHNIMEKYLPYINGDHIFLGSFHNGKSSITGIPYCKYDIVAELFSSKSLTLEQDNEFAGMYKDVDILRHNKLPMAVLLSGLVYYKINPDKTSELSKIDDIIYRRMLGRDIKQFACAIIRQYTDDINIDGKPIGFVGVIKYDYDEINLKELQNCTDELLSIYNGKN